MPDDSLVVEVHCVKELWQDLYKCYNISIISFDIYYNIEAQNHGTQASKSG
jgi:hypothetical protein